MRPPPGLEDAGIFVLPHPLAGFGSPPHSPTHRPLASAQFRPPDVALSPQWPLPPHAYDALGLSPISMARAKLSDLRIKMKFRNNTLA